MRKLLKTAVRVSLATCCMAAVVIAQPPWKDPNLAPLQYLDSLPMAQGPFQPTWESLDKYKAPDWFRDAKFGIFLHWSVNEVPERDGWYGKHMFIQHPKADCEIKADVYNYHVSHYGHPSIFGYKDLIPLWKAEKWDPDALVQLSNRAGARYIMPVAVHHDNFDRYNSTYQVWNSVSMGPHRDVDAWRGRNGN